MSRVLPDQPYESLGQYLAAGGGAGLRAARAVSPGTVIEELDESGLHGRGGAGFPTGVKWRTVRSFASSRLHTTVVVNAAEGEPGTFKDRMILRRNSYAVLEGALIAAHAVDAKSIVVGIKATFLHELQCLRTAIGELRAAGWLDEVDITITEGPSEYLFGEETALLEVIDGRPPFPRVAPPYRHGVVEVVGSRADAEPSAGSTANVQMAGLDGQSAAPPVLINNVETLANVPAIIARSAAWFREVGTADSPGTVVCTVSGDVRHPAVVEVPMGTTLRAVLELAGGVPDGRTLGAVLVGVSNAVVTADQLDTPLSYEAMSAIGSGLGSASFIVVANDVAPIAIAASVARFLAIESCGQCMHCKQDGMDIARILSELARRGGEMRDLAAVELRLSTVAEGARCGLAAQQQVVVGSLLRTFAETIDAGLLIGSASADATLVAPLLGIDDEGAALDASFASKQPDWTYEGGSSGHTPVDRFRDRAVATTER